MKSDVPAEGVIAGIGCMLTGTTIDQYGEPATAQGTVTVTVTDSQGSSVTSGAVDSTADPVHTAAIAVANMPTGPDLLTAVWADDSNTFATNVIDVHGGVYFTLADLHADTALIPGASSANVDGHRKARREVERMFESVQNRAWVPRFRTAILSGDGTSTLILPTPDLLRGVVWANYWTGSAWAAISGTVADIPQNDRGTAILRDGVWPSGLDNIQIGYRHGTDRPPADVERAAIRATELHVTGDDSGIMRRATQVQTEFGVVPLAVPGDRQWHTGDPQVDEVLNRPGYILRRLAQA